jgi:hypothetical protein
LIGNGNDLCQGEDAHLPDLRVKSDHFGNVYLLVLEGVDIGFGGLLGEFSIKILSADLVLGKLLRARPSALS